MLVLNALGAKSLREPQVVKLSRPVAHHMALDVRAWAQRLAYVDGGYEPDTVDFLHALSAPDQSPGYLLDVGACIGAITVPYAVIRRNELPVSVIAFEAVGDNAKLLRENVGLNSLTANVVVHGVALGEAAKTVDIQVEGDRKAGEGAGTANILAEESKYECVRQTIQVMRLDDLALPHGCGVVKIDTDGYDLKVMQGATSFLRRERPVVFGEFSAHCMNWHGQTVDDVARFCESIDYRLYARADAGFRFMDKVQKDSFVQDLLLVPAEKLAAMSPYLIADHGRFD